jgi:hypothetical protein
MTQGGRVNRAAHRYFHGVPLDAVKQDGRVRHPPPIGDHATGGTPAWHVFAIAIG